MTLSNNLPGAVLICVTLQDWIFYHVEWSL